MRLYVKHAIRDVLVLGAMVALSAVFIPKGLAFSIFTGSATTMTFFSVMNGRRREKIHLALLASLEKALGSMVELEHEFGTLSPMSTGSLAVMTALSSYLKSQASLLESVQEGLIGAGVDARVSEAIRSVIELQSTVEKRLAQLAPEHAH